MKKIIILLGILLGLSIQAQSWNLTGNSGTNPASDFIGTIDNTDLVIKTTGLERMRIKGNGTVYFSLPPQQSKGNVRVVIGTNNDLANCGTCNDYSLFVKKGIKTEKVKVEFANENGWADYVFEDDYKLMPLDEVKKFIKQNKHLPEVPTAKEVVENGLELKEFNALLLKKIEEVTLHIINMNEKILHYEEEIRKLQQKSIENENNN